MDFTRPERCRPQRTGREDRHSKFYEITDNLDRRHPALHVSELDGPCLVLARSQASLRRHPGCHARRLRLHGLGARVPDGGPFLRGRLPQFLGRISYSLYLLHAVVLLALAHALNGQVPTGVIIALMWILVLPLAALSQRWVELPAVWASGSQPGWTCDIAVCPRASRRIPRAQRRAAISLPAQAAGPAQRRRPGSPQ